jgi:hypothetical protein
MNDPTKLLERLNEIGRSLSNTPHALALIGLGSVGQELDRIDQYSDLDFFVLVETGYQAQFLADLSWLSNIAPIAFQFLNTRDGYKLLFEDGIFCEFAVFEPEQLAEIPFSPGRIVWKAADVSDAIAQPLTLSASVEPRTQEFLLGEAITNLYVGLGRELRGEKFSAMRFIQGYAVDRVIELIPLIETAAPAYQDTFDNARRVEFRYPITAEHFPQFLQGYDKNCESALAILNFLDYHFDVNQRMKAEIIRLVSVNSRQ